MYTEVKIALKSFVNAWKIVQGGSLILTGIIWK